MSTAKRRKLDVDTASNGSGRGTSSRRAATGATGKGTAGGAASGSGLAGGAGGGALGGGNGAGGKGNGLAAGLAAGGASAGGLGGGGGPSAAESGPYVPVLPLSSLPVAALARYALHYALVPPEPLTPAQATHPTPALPRQLPLASSYYASPHQPVFRRRASFIPERRHRSDKLLPVAGPSSTQQGDGLMELDRAQPGGEHGASSTSKAANAGAEPSTAKTLNGQMEPSPRSQEPEWEDPGEPDAEELRGMTAYDGGIEQFRERLGGLAKTHWDRTQTVKEGETIVNFAYAIRMRSKILKSVPPP